MDVQLVALTYPSMQQAEAALAAAEQAEPIDAVLVRRAPGGRVELRQTREGSVGEGAVSGGTVGLLAGLLLGVPVGAALVGVLAGASWGARDTGISDERLRALGRSVENGQAMLCLLVEQSSRADMIRLLAPYAGVPADVGLAPP